MVESYTSFSSGILPDSEGILRFTLLVNLVQNSKPFRLYHTTAFRYPLLFLQLDLGYWLLVTGYMVRYYVEPYSWHSL